MSTEKRQEFIVLIIGVAIALSASCKKSAEKEDQNKKAIASLPYIGGAEVLPGQEERVGAFVVDEDKAHEQDIVLDLWSEKRFIVIDRDGKRKREPLVTISADSILEDHIFHHDFVLDSEGNIVTLVGATMDLPGPDGTLFPIHENFIAFVSPQGELLRKISAHKLFKDSVSKEARDSLKEDMGNEKFKGVMQTTADLYHANTIDRVRNEGGFAPKGSLLVTIKRLNMLAVIDPNTEKVLWTYTGALDWPHGGKLIKDEKEIVVFDNGSHRGASKALSIDPESKQELFSCGLGA